LIDTQKEDGGLEKKAAVFAKSRIFKQLSMDEHQALASQATPVHLKKGAILFRDGEKAQFFYIVEKGLLKLYKVSSTGKNITFSIATVGDTLNAVALSAENYFMTAQAINEVSVLRIEKKDFMAFLGSHPAVALEIIAILARRLGKDYQKTVDIIGEESEQRLLHSLFFLGSRFGPVLYLNREELADFCGLTTETTIRALSKLKKKEIISSSSGRGKIVIKDMDKLKLLTHNE
jgi:CRP/FNR family transcriptional regulator